MDTELARTFLEIVATRSFIRAAERLHVGQTTVSARVRTLEERLGRQLFVRKKSGVILTPAGEQFLRHAPAIVQLWQRVHHAVALPEGHRAVLTIGAEVSLWHPLLLSWVQWMRRSLPDVALRVHVDVPRDLLDQVASGLVDAAVIYAPPSRPGLRTDLLLDERLVFATTDPTFESINSPSFVAVDWGEDFKSAFASGFPNAVGPGLSFDLGPLALSYVLAAGGSGYFRLLAVEPHLASGKLHLVPGMPQFSYPIHVVSSVDADHALLGPALAALREIAVAKHG
ncbi:MAG: LysR family transcriptional regulator [Candidatus Kaistia colombiensis]|nr:MAG: LysR family transcriptional regulator [Kaistia sp.]